MPAANPNKHASCWPLQRVDNRLIGVSASSPPVTSSCASVSAWARVSIRVFSEINVAPSPDPDPFGRGVWRAVQSGRRAAAASSGAAKNGFHARLLIGGRRLAARGRAG